MLENLIQKICEKNNLSGQGLEEKINSLVEGGIVTPIKAKRLKAYAAIRNDALHARWDNFDIKDVGEMIAGIKESIETYL